MPVKILGRGELTKKFTVQAHKFSASAREQIEAAGGTCPGRRGLASSTMISTIFQSFRVAEIRNKLLFTAAVLAIYRLGSFIPVPGVDVDAVEHDPGQLLAAASSAC